jgi:hypothetical protein
MHSFANCLNLSHIPRPLFIIEACPTAYPLPASAAAMR